MAYPHLFTPGQIGNVTVKNRVVMPPMMLGFGQFDGTPTEKMMDYYEERAIGGVGLIVTEITRVNDFSGASAFAQLAISHDYHIAPLKKMIDRVHRHGTKMFIQLHHPGRQNLGLLMGTVPVSVAMHRLLGNTYDKLFYKVAPVGKKLMEKDFVLKTLSPSQCARAYSAESLNREMTVQEIGKIRCRRCGTARGARVFDSAVFKSVYQPKNRLLRRLFGKPYALFAGDFTGH